MGTFTYKARTQEGKAIEGQMEATSAEEAAKKLKHEGFLPVRIHEKKRAPSSGKLFGPRVSASQMILFNNQLANLISAGVPLLSSLRTIAKVVEHKRLKEILEQLSHRIASGSSFSESLSEHRDAFPDLFISMVKAGETGGQLNLILQRYAVYLEGQEEIRQKVTNALMYPALVLAFGVLAVAYILGAVIPKFVEIFDHADVALPWATQFLYQTGLVVKNYYFFFFLGAVFIAIIFQAIRKTEAVGRLLDRLELAAPVFGPLKRKVYLSRFCRSLATLLQSGVSLLQTLMITEDLIGNRIMRDAIGRARLRVEQGEPLSKTLERSSAFPPDIIQMIAVGEESGELSKMLNKMADYYDKIIDQGIKQLIVLIEPLLIIVMSAVVGIILASVILPLFDMIKTIK